MYHRYMYEIQLYYSSNNNENNNNNNDDNNSEHNTPDVLDPWLADASWLRVGAGGLLASNGFCWWELVVIVDVVPKGLAGEGPPYPTGLRGGREPRESRSTRTAFSPKNWSSTLPGCVL